MRRRGIALLAIALAAVLAAPGPVAWATGAANGATTASSDAGVTNKDVPTDDTGVVEAGEGAGNEGAGSEGADGGAAPAAEIIQAAQPGQAAGADALTLPADVARLASHAAKLAGTAPATWARQALESAAAAEADAFERKQAALSAFKKFKPEQTAPGNSGDLPPEQAGSKTPGD